MHPSSAAVDLAALRRQARQRFAGRPAVLDALLDAVIGQTDLAALTVDEGLRLQALLESRSDEELERIARRGHPGRSRLNFQVEAVVDGEITAAERAEMAQRLLDHLRNAPWPVPSVRLRAVLVTDLRDGSADLAV